MIAIGIITALNVILWLIMLIRFRKLFSTEKIIEKTRRQIEQLNNELNANASRDIQLVEATIRNLRQMNNIAKESADALDKKLSLVKAEEEREAGVKVFSEKLWNNTATNGMPAGVEKINPYASMNPYAKVSVNESSRSNEGSSVSKWGNGTSAKNMDQKNRIKHLYNQGMSVVEIAEELSCSEMEVQFTIDLG